jgi:hypothetical protein
MRSTQGQAVRESEGSDLEAGATSALRIVETFRFLSERQQRIAFGTAQPAARMLAEKEHHEGEDQAEADGKSKRNDGHGGTGWVLRGEIEVLTLATRAATGSAGLVRRCADFASLRVANAK